MRTIKQRDFGKDHWATFAYIETICVDHGGVPNKDKMRVNPRLHPGLLGPTQSRLGFPCWKSEYATHLIGSTGKKPRQVRGHDDWHCADDLQAAGLIESKGTGINPIFTLTKFGLAISASLRAHKAGGGNFLDFVPPVTPPPERKVRK